MGNRTLAVLSLGIAVSIVGYAEASESVCPRPIFDKQTFEELISDPNASHAERAWWQNLQQQSYKAWAQCQTEHLRYVSGSARDPIDRDNRSSEAQPQSASAEIPTMPTMGTTTGDLQPRSTSSAIASTSSMSTTTSALNHR
jgi:hypothetical protein